MGTCCHGDSRIEKGQDIQYHDSRTRRLRDDLSREILGRDTECYGWRVASGAVHGLEEGLGYGSYRGDVRIPVSSGRSAYVGEDKLEGRACLRTSYINPFTAERRH